MKYYEIGIGGTIISKSEARKHKWDWPFYLLQDINSSGTDDGESSDSNDQESFPPKVALADPLSALIRILDPQNATPEICSKAQDLLTDYYLSADSSGSLVPPLVEPVQATVYLFRRRMDSEVEPEPDWTDPTPDSDFKRLLSCHFKLKFMENDAFLPSVKPLVLHLNDILGTDYLDYTKVITYDLNELAKKIIKQKPRMKKRRAIDRAHAAIKLLRNRQNQEAKKRDAQRSVTSVSTPLPANTFTGFKKQRQEERDAEEEEPEDSY